MGCSGTQNAAKKQIKGTNFTSTSKRLGVSILFPAVNMGQSRRADVCNSLYSRLDEANLADKWTGLAPGCNTVHMVALCGSLMHEQLGMYGMFRTGITGM
jgi:hypothetical protein